MTHNLPELGYGYDALEPYIDAKTMEIHHTKHHQAYINKLNTALEKHPELKDKKVEDLLKDLKNIPEDIRTAIRNHAGGHFNHSFWWPLLKQDIEFKGEIVDAINKRFGSFEKFKEEFTNKSMTLFGSGWCWLVISNGELEIIQTANQDCPLSQDKKPIIGLDLWEHAYYLKNSSNRGAYIEAFFGVINWDKVNENYKQANSSQS